MRMLKRAALVAALALLALPQVAGATKYYLNGGKGNDTYTGLTPAQAWKNTAKACASTASGDTVIVMGYSGAYGRINYKASVDGKYTYWIADAPNAQKWYKIAISDSLAYMVLDGLTLTSGTSGLGALAQFDTLKNCQLTSTTQWNVFGAKYIILYRCFTSGTSAPLVWLDGRFSKGVPTGVKLIQCTLGDSVSAYGRLQIRGTDSVTVDRCVIWGNSNSDYPIPYIRASTNFKMKYSRLVNNRAGYNTSYIMNLQDSLSGAEFSNDTIMDSPKALGCFCAVRVVSVTPIGSNIWFDSCYVATKTGMPFYWTNTFYNSKLTYNTIATNGAEHAWNIDNYTGRNFIDHNTFIGYAANGVVAHGSVSDHPMHGDVTIFTNNIVSPNANCPAVYWDCESNWQYPDCVINNLASRRYAVDWNVRGIDSTYCANYGDSGVHGLMLRSEHNLYSYLGWDTPDSLYKHSILQNFGANGVGDVGAGDYGARPGTGTNWTLQWCLGCDDSSKAGSAGLARGGADSAQYNDYKYYAYGTPFDARISRYSLARGNGSGSTDIGAVAYAGGAAMSVNPISIMFLDNPEVTGQKTEIAIINNAPSGSGDSLYVYDIIAYTAESGLSIVTNTCYGVDHKIAPGQGCIFSVQFEPSGNTEQRSGGYIAIRSNDIGRGTINVPIYINPGATEPGGGHPRFEE